MFSSNTSQVSNAANYIEDVFSTYLYPGTGSSNTINNGLDESTKGALTWIKERGTASTPHMLFDTNRGVGKYIQSNTTGSEGNIADTLTAFNTNGFTLGADSFGVCNASGKNYVSWTFRKQPKFFDVQTFTDSPHQAQTINHSLGATPAMVILKSTSGADNWYVYHTSLGTSSYLTLNAIGGSSSFANWITVSSTQVTIAASFLSSGTSYVMYIFASNAGGFGLTGTDNVISCGSYSGGAGTTYVTLGYEPQFILKKNSSANGNWVICDNMRGMPTGGNSTTSLFPNTSGAETTGTDANGYLFPTATGFGDGNANSGQTYIYIAIRRGPMKVPTSGTSVFMPFAVNDTVNSTTNFPVDIFFDAVRAGNALNTQVGARLIGTNTLTTSSIGAEAGYAGTNWFRSNTQFAANIFGASCIEYAFSRAPSFADVVCYTGSASSLVINHNLGVTPELIITKRRNGTGGRGPVWVPAWGYTDFFNYLELNQGPSNRGFNYITAANASTYTVANDTGNGYFNNTGGTYVAYLFATCAGVSKVGSYTGTGTLTTINCGFTSGARFVLIKRTDTTSDWFVWDTARGMVSGTDPSLSLNTTSAESNANSVYTVSTGFQLLASPSADVNTSGGTYIYLAIA